MTDLLEALRAHPLIAEPWGEFGAIEVLDMRANERGTPGFVGVLNHHTVSNRNSGAYPSKGICRNGRGGSHPVPGPLCNLLGARDGGSVGVISSRVANHAGTGDPDVLRRVRAGQAPKPRPGPDRSNAGGGSGLLGIEWENDGTGEPWSPRMIDTMVRVNAALCDLFGWDPLTAVLGHLEWTTRKIDPAFHTPRMDMAGFRRLVAATLTAWRAGSPPPNEQDDDMPLSQNDLDAIYLRVVPALTGSAIDDVGDTVTNLGDLVNLVNAQTAAVLDGMLRLGVGMLTRIADMLDEVTAPDAARIVADLRVQLAADLTAAVAALPGVNAATVADELARRLDS